MRPSSVCMPVAVTSTRASPPVQVVPVKTRSRGPSPRGDGVVEDGGATGPAPTHRSSVDMSSSTGAGDQPARPHRPCLRPLWRRASRRPAPEPPGVDLHPLAVAHDVALGGAGREARASIERSACSCSTKANAALRMITISTAIATTTLPDARASAAAPHRSSASGCVSWRPRSRGQLRVVRRSSSFGPCTTSRRAASRLDRPSGPLPRSRSTRSSARWGSCTALGIDARPSDPGGRHLLRDAVDVAAAEQDLAGRHAHHLAVREAAASTSAACSSLRSSSSGIDDAAWPR